ncbi:MAG: hypothetical protein JOZ53_03730 [Planctomycetaceae bacterium]|nr:hypothetical protein [Planctomycetaceae bacterium]
MNLEQIDAMLADLRARSGRIGDDLLELTQAITYQRLVGEGGWPKVALAGATEVRVAPALVTLSDLWELSALLNQVLARATALRNSVSWILPSHKTLDEIEQLLCGPSIELPPDRRGLAAPTARSLSPGELLEVMARSFRLAREAVLAVDAAWDRLLPALANFEDEAAAIQGLADALKEPAPAELAEARRKILSLREAVEHDPLAAVARGEEIASLLKAARARLDDLARDRDRAGAMVAEARQLLDSLEEAHRRARQAHADREAKVQADAPAVFPRPLDDGQVAALGPWLEKLDASVREGQWKPALVGLARWTAIVRQYLADEEATREANDAPLRARRDLRGLLDALKAKARSNSRAEDIELDALAQEAWRLLHSRPTPLAEARRLVAEYQARLL